MSIITYKCTLRVIVGAKPCSGYLMNISRNDHCCSRIGQHKVRGRVGKHRTTLKYCYAVAEKCSLQIIADSLNPF